MFTDAARRQLHIHQRLRRHVSRAIGERIVKVSERSSRGVAATGIRGGLDRSTRRRSVVPRLVSFSFSRARPHRHLFRRRSRARVQRSLCFKRERHRHRSRAARFVDVVVVLCARESSSHRRGEKNRTSLLSEMTVGDDKQMGRGRSFIHVARLVDRARDSFPRTRDSPSRVPAPR